MSDYRCELCWTTFDSPVELLLHEAADDDRVWFMDGFYEPSTSADTHFDE